MAAGGANRDKIVASAQKYIQRGQLDKAIKEFQRILEEEPKDVRTLLKVGDLYSKKGERDKATETYLKVADFYSDQGFFLKAVAVYKQILKVEPTLVAVQHKLADLYGQLGLTSDALQQYHGVAQHFEKAGEMTRTVQVLRRMTELEPANFGSHIKLGEIYAKQNLLAEAVQELTLAAGHLRQANRLDDYARVTERILQLQPENAPLTLELAEYYLQRNDVKRALAKLQTAFKSNPRDITTLEMLARAFQALEQPHKTASIFKELAKIYGEQGDADKKRQFLRKVLEVAPDDQEVRDELEFKLAAKPAAPASVAQTSVAPTTSPPSQPSAKPPLPRVAQAAPPPPAVQAAPVKQPPPAQPPAPPQSITERPVGQPQATAPLKLSGPPSAAARGESLSKLLTETDVYLKYGLRDKALDHLKTIFSLDPDNLEAHGKVHEVYMQSGDTDGAKETLLTMAKISQKRGDKKAALERVQDILRLDAAHQEAQKMLRELGGQAPVAASIAPPIAPPAVSDEPELLSDDEGVDLLVEDEPVAAASPVRGGRPVEDDELHTGEQDLDVDDSLFGGNGVDALPRESVDTRDAEGGVDIDLDITANARQRAEMQKAVEVAKASGLVKTLPAPAEGTSEELDDGLDIDLGPPPDDLQIDEPATGVVVDTDFDAPFEDEPRALANAAASKPQPIAAPETMAHEDATAGEDVLIGGEAQGEELDLGGGESLSLDEDTSSETLAPGASLAGLDSLDQNADDDITGNPNAAIGAEDEFATASGVADEVNVDDELEEADFLEQQGLTEEAVEAYRAVLVKAPKNAKAKERLAALDGGGDELELDPPAATKAPVPPVAVASKSIDDELDLDGPSTDEHAPVAPSVPRHEFDSNDSSDLFEDEPTAAPEAASAAIAKPSAKVPTKSPELSAKHDKTVKAGGETGQLLSQEALSSAPEFDLMSELADDFADAADAAPPSDDEIQFSADEVFAEFKKGVAKTVSDKDYATHYDLGIAYREMGLVEDAIAEFEVASKAPEKEVDSWSMVGLCRRELSDLDGAIAAYKKAANSDRCTPKQIVAIEYELAVSLEMKGDHAGALRLFAKVAKADPAFRDAKQRASGAPAKAPAGPVEEEEPQMPPPPAGGAPRKGKISYL